MRDLHDIFVVEVVAVVLADAVLDTPGGRLVLAALGLVVEDHYCWCLWGVALAPAATR